MVIGGTIRMNAIQNGIESKNASTTVTWVAPRASHEISM